MPLGKYYCDYCDKEFQDTPLARKRHLQSSQHQRTKSLWYHSLPSSPDPNPTHTRGELCNRFISKGFCKYGDSCRYYHPVQNANLNPQNIAASIQNPAVFASQVVGGSSFSGETVRGILGNPFGNLPPSLKPPPEGGYPSLPFIDWG